MKNIMFNDVLVAWDDLMYPKFEDEKMVVYKLTFIDDTFYIGKTTNSIVERLHHHCTDFNTSLVSEKIQNYLAFKVDILHKCNTENDLTNYEKKYIHEVLEKCSQQNEKWNIYNVPKEIIHKELLNEVLYRT
jgi:predicted GIY-YIG superfamily endonuclease